MIGRFTLRDIRTVWGYVKPGIMDIKNAYNMDWQAEDIYAQCRMGVAFCYTCYDGFLIVKPQENQFTLQKELFVWICHSQAKEGLTEYYEDIKAIAKDINAVTIRFESPREGFRKIAKQNDWDHMTTYSFEVN